ncbi:MULTISPECIES: spore coat protein [Paenibacillus]|uniref:spore coat protein n=1 Tax=Paenibacillus TaxID=44249 RepID=UPI000888E337|nr:MULTISPECIES: spore coat protein [Paenibacillus]TDL67882.1 spore coat protein [Paenibacillus amylolyticus]UOK65205.1 spore coat protein [Paenibacillus sp. OVF10]SDC91259.1 Coat F domain-containing protein [Paenibacillus sp. CF095]
MYTQSLSSGGNFMQEQDLLKSILADLRRTSREYTTATTEASCPMTRRMFTDLTNDTLRLQGELFNLMQQNNMYSVSSKALRQDVDKQIQSAHQTQQKCQQFIQEKNSQNSSYSQAPNVPQHQPNNGNPYYM